MHPKDLSIDDFTYDLPDERIAKYPLAERDASKLAIWKDGVITEDTYRNIAAHIPAGTLMIFNQTKVVHARLLFKKATGSTIEVFCLAPAAQYTDIQTAMLQKGSVQWECLVGGAAKWKNGMVLTQAHADPAFTLSATIAERNPTSFILSLSWDADLTFAEVLHYAGKVPLPPYLHREADATDDDRYQTTYAKDEGSVAAPTAGLHFTEGIMQSLNAKNINAAYVTLHVGAGTFRPVKSPTMQGHNMHEEWIDVGIDTLRQIIAGPDKKIVAVGTTSLRTLESLYWIGNKWAQGRQVDLHGVAVTQWEPYETPKQCTPKEALDAIVQHMAAHGLQRITTRTQIMIAPGYLFRVADGLVTNFHQPQSTLLLLVSAFIGTGWHTLYDHALQHGFRFLSYGDGGLLWRVDHRKA